MLRERSCILAIDDTPANLFALGAALEGEYEMQFASAGPMGIALALEDPPDLILLDVMMPEVDGYETLRRIKAEPKLKHIPVVFVTALTDSDSEVSGLSLGAADYVTKPINVEVVRRRVCNLIERENLRKEVEENRDRLEALVLERTMALSIATKATEAANQAKIHFLGNMSHELRTPLNAIIGMTEMAQMLATNPRQAEHLNTVQRASDQLLGLISRLMELTALETQQLTLETSDFKLPSVMDGLTDLLGHEARNKGLAMGISMDAGVKDLLLRGDPVRLGQILLCLADNAIKFTSQGQIRVLVSVVEQSADSVAIRFEVHDTGIGIALVDQERIFALFEQADNSFQRHHGGTGIGLSLSRQLIHLMGGSFGLESRPGSGSVFWFVVRMAVFDAALGGKL